MRIIHKENFSSIYMTKKTKNGEQNNNIPYNIMNIFLDPSQIADQQQIEEIVNFPASEAPPKVVMIKRKKSS